MLMSQQMIAGIIFLVAYLLIIFRFTRPVLIVYLAVGALLLSQAITIDQALAAINLNVIGIVWGTMVLAELFVASRATDYLAGKIVSRMPTVSMALVAVSALSGFISSFVDNVATVLIIAPVAFQIARSLKISPAPFLIGVAVSSNLQGMATMIGDSTSVILATTANMDFLDFFWMQGRPGIFFAVQIAAISATLILWFLFRNMKQPVALKNRVRVLSWAPSRFLGFLVFALAASSFIPNKPVYTVGIITVLLAFTAILWNLFWGKLEFRIQKLDWETLLFLIGIFILVGSLSETGIVNRLANLIAQATGGSKLTAFLLLIWLSVLVSAFIDNIPYSIAMLPVAQQVGISLDISPYLLMFGLLIGTSLGGNITPIGASANIVAMGMLRRNGYDVSFKEFTRIGLPFTLIAVITASLFIWLFWS